MRYVDRRRLREKRALARELRRRSTPEERVLWQRLRRNQILGVHFRRQHVLSGFIMDFYCPRARLAVELDGGYHENQRDADIQRQKALESMNIVFLRFRNEEVRDDLEGTIRRIEEIVSDRIRSSSPFPCPGEGVRGLGG